MISGLESIQELDFEHFSEMDDSDSNSSKFQFLYCTGIDSSGQFIGRPQTFVELQLRFKLHFLV